MSRFETLVKETNSPSVLISNPTVQVPGNTDSVGSVDLSTIDGRTSVSPLVHSAAGTIGALIAMIVAYPLDNLRTRLQVSKRESSLGVFSALDDLLKKEGWKGLYAGLRSALIGVGVSWAVYYYFYAFFRAYCQRKMGKNITKSTVANLAIAFAAGSLSAVATNPIWVVNTRQKLRQNKNENESFFQSLMNLAKEEGISGLSSGLSASLVLVANPAIQFAVYEQLRSTLALHKSKIVTSRKRDALKSSFSGRKLFGDSFHSSNAASVVSAASAAASSLTDPAAQLSATEIFVIGAASKLVATIATYPYQVIKSRLHARQQVNNTHPSGASNANSNGILVPSSSTQPGDRVDGYGGSLDCLVRVLEGEGIAGLFRGLESKVLATGLTSAIMFVSYELLVRSAAKIGKKGKK